MANEKNYLTQPVLDYKGEKVGEVTLPEELFGTEINEVVVQRAVCVDLSNRRLGTAKTLDRSEVHGSNRKPYGQKHTGRARAGTTNSPIWRHGGVVHGPNGEQSYKLKMNKKEHFVAFTSVLTDKAQGGNVIVLTDEACPSAKTKDFVQTLKSIHADEKKNLLVVYGLDENLIRASSNIPSITLTTADNVSVYDVLNANKLILVKGVIPTQEAETEEQN